MSEIKFDAKTVKQNENSIDADTVILNMQKAALDLDVLIDRHVRKKYPEKYIAKPSQEEARQLHKGWRILKYLPDRQEFKEVTSMDEATVSKGVNGNVYAWRDVKIQNYIDKQHNDALSFSNRKANSDSTKTQADGLTNTLSGISGGKIKAKPLDDSEE